MRAGAAPRGGLAAVQRQVRDLAKRLERIERLLRGRRDLATLDPDLRAELGAWEAASDEALAKVDHAE